jgi:hypothetical protein
MTDARSPLAVKIMDANRDAYEALVVEGGTPSFAHEQLGGIQAEQLLASPAKSPVDAYAMLAALWLWHDGLSECHEIVQKSPENLLQATQKLHRDPAVTASKALPVQSVEVATRRDPQHLRDMTAMLAYWHAVMHRREGDFSSSKYWYARAEGHPIYMSLATRADDLLRQVPADKQVFRITARGWNPSALVDLVEAVYQTPNDPRHGLAVALQRLEWQTMFDAGVRAAAG